jgi:sulfur carrier protein ThiS
VKVTLRLGEPFWRTAGARAIELDLNEGATVADALSALKQRHPALAAELDGAEAQPAVFVNDDEAQPDSRVFDGATIFVVWPVSGG